MPESNTRLKDAMLHAVSTTLENMAFMEARPLVTDHNCLNLAEVYCASLLVHDPVQGELVLFIPEALLKKIAGVIYAQSNESFTDQMLSDLSSELLNTIAGVFLGNLLPPTQTFEMGLPTISKFQCQELEPSAERWHFQVDGDYLCVSVGGSSWEQIKIEN